MKAPTLTSSARGAPRRSPTPYFLGVLGLAVVRILTTHISSCTTYTEWGRIPEVVYQQALVVLQGKESSGGPYLCETNPFVGALEESLDEISSRMDLSLEAMGNHHQKAMSETSYNHGRFSPLTPCPSARKRLVWVGHVAATLARLYVE